MEIRSEANFTLYESISMIVGHSIGTGIVAVPYLATKNRLVDVFWMILLGYCINVVLHLMIAELSYNNGGVQLVKSFESELFEGRYKKAMSWGMFVVYGLAIALGVSGNINGGAQILEAALGIPFYMAQLIYYLLAGVVVFKGMKAVGIAQKYAVSALIGIVLIMTVATMSGPVYGIQESTRNPNNMLALYSMIVFATSANQAVIQSVKGLNGDTKKIRASIFIGFAISSIFVLVVTTTVLLGVHGGIHREMAYLQLGKNIGLWAAILAGIFSLFALLTTFWSNTLSLRDVVHEQTGIDNKLCWVMATMPSLLFAVFGVSSFILLTRIMSGIVVLVGIMLILTYSRSRSKVGSSPICGIIGSKPFLFLMLASTILSAVGAMIPLR